MHCLPEPDNVRQLDDEAYDADDLVFPEYFGDLGIRYSRSQTLACGGDCCDFRVERGG